MMSGFWKAFFTASAAPNRGAVFSICGILRCGAVRCGAVRCRVLIRRIVRCGAVQCGFLFLKSIHTVRCAKNRQKKMHGTAAKYSILITLRPCRDLDLCDVRKWCVFSEAFMFPNRTVKRLGEFFIVVENPKVRRDAFFCRRKSRTVRGSKRAPKRTATQRKNKPHREKPRIMFVGFRCPLCLVARITS